MQKNRRKMNAIVASQEVVVVKPKPLNGELKNINRKGGKLF
jgi:CpcD/allophycocyanin linker domain